MMKSDNYTGVRVRRKKKPAAPLRAWRPFGVALALALLVGELTWNAGVSFPLSVILVVVCVVLGLDILHKHGTRALYVAAVVFGLVIGNFRMMTILMMLI